MHVVAANAANTAGHIEAKIVPLSGNSGPAQPLTKAQLVHNLQEADYLTFTGHGGSSYLRLDEDTTLRPADLPALPPVVVATGSCNTFRPWQADSIALAFADKGAAAYAGFAYSPNEGYLVGEFRGAPLRYTWPEVPAGHVIQLQNHGALQGFAYFPYYYLMGDPRLALQPTAPYQLVADDMTGASRRLRFDTAPAGYIPVRIPDGARYRFVRIPGVAAARYDEPFYNARLQMVNIGTDKFVLFQHTGGSFSLHLHEDPPWAWVLGDMLLDAFDHVLLLSQQGGGDLLSLAGGLMALALCAWQLWRKRASRQGLAPALLAGIGWAGFYSLYALARLDQVTITSKTVALSPVSLVAALLLAGSGTFLALTARSWPGIGLGILAASFGALAPAAFTLGVLTVLNTLYYRPELGAPLWNYALGLMPLLAFAGEALFFALLFVAGRKTLGYPRELATPGGRPPTHPCALSPRAHLSEEHV
jgi:hypothetical protein